MRKLFLVLLLIVSIGCSGQSKIETLTPEHTAAIDSLIESEIKVDHIPGAVIQIKKGDSILHRAAYGFAHKYDYGMERLKNPVPMTTEHLFYLASLTKVMGTTFGIMKLFDKGTLSLNDPIYKYLPEFQKGAKSEITIRHLLTHSSGLSQWFPTYYQAANKDERYQYIANLPLKCEVGEGRHYSDLGFMLLADIIERITSQPLDQFLQQSFFINL